MLAEDLRIPKGKKLPMYLGRAKEKRNRLTDIEYKLVVTSGERELRGTNYYV